MGSVTSGVGGVVGCVTSGVGGVVGGLTSTLTLGGLHLKRDLEPDAGGFLAKGGITKVLTTTIAGAMEAQR